MEPKSYYKNLVGTYAMHNDKNASLDVIEPMPSVPASMKLRGKGIHLVVKDGNMLYCVNPRLANAVTRYCEKSGVLESALSSMKTVESATAERPAVVLDAEAQLAD